MYPLRNELWRHYKGGIYTIIGTGYHTETNEVMVAYTKDHKTIWFRPYEMWHEPVMHNDQCLSRFTKMSRTETWIFKLLKSISQDP